MEGLDVGDLVMGAMDYWVMDLVSPAAMVVMAGDFQVMDMATVSH